MASVLELCPCWRWFPQEIEAVVLASVLNIACHGAQLAAGPCSTALQSDPVSLRAWQWQDTATGWSAMLLLWVCSAAWEQQPYGQSLRMAAQPSATACRPNFVLMAVHRIPSYNQTVASALHLQQGETQTKTKKSPDGRLWCPCCGMPATGTTSCRLRRSSCLSRFGLHIQQEQTGHELCRKAESLGASDSTHGKCHMCGEHREDCELFNEHAECTLEGRK